MRAFLFSLPSAIPKLAGLIPGALLVVLLLNGCPGPSPTPPISVNQLNIVELDSLWIITSTQYRRIVVQAYPADWSRGRTIRCQIRGEGISTHFNLYDDGGLSIWQDGAGFCDTISGDNVAGDGKFSRRMNSLFTGREGNYSLAFAFHDHPDQTDTLKADITVVANSTPTIAWTVYPDTIPSGASSIFQASIFDMDGENDIARVELRRSGTPTTRPPDVSYRMLRSNDSLYEWASIPSLAAGYPTGRHRFYARATDWAMSQRADYTRTDTVDVWLVNGPPSIVSIAASDTIWMLPGQSVQGYAVAVRLADDQTFVDLDILYLEVWRYDSTLQRERMTFDTTYYDDGDTLTQVSPVPGDGEIIAAFRAESGTPRNIPYYFRWTPSDRAGQLGEMQSNTVVIADAGNGSPPFRIERLLRTQDLPSVFK